MATSLEVTFAAYLAVLLGTLLPTLFLIVLYLNSEARKIGDFSEEGTVSDYRGRVDGFLLEVRWWILCGAVRSLWELSSRG